MISGAVGPGDHDADESSIWQVSILGGKPRRLRGDAYRAMLAPDDSFIAYMNDEGIFLTDAGGANPRLFIQNNPTSFVGSPRWSPDSKRVIYRRAAWTEGGVTTTIESRGLDEEASVVLVTDEPPAGHERIWRQDFLVVGPRLLYAKSEPPPRRRDQNLWELALDPLSGRPAGEPRRLSDWVGFRIQGLSAPADGSQLTIENDEGQSDVYIGGLGEGGRTLGAPRRLTLDDRDDLPTCWTRDGSAVVFHSDRNGTDDLFVQGVEERSAQELVTGAQDQADGQPTPGGDSLLYWESTNVDRMWGPRRLRRVPAGGGPTESVYDARLPAILTCATRAGGPCMLAEVRVQERTATFSRFDPVKGKGEELFRRDFRPELGVMVALSPDGKQLAMIGHTEGVDSIRLLDAESGEAVADVDFQGVENVTYLDFAWAPDGRGWYLVGDTTRGAVLLHTDLQGRTDRIFEDRTADFYGIKPSPDGSRLAFGQFTWKTNVWMIEQF